MGLALLVVVLATAGVNVVLGLAALPGGMEAYRSEVLGWTTMPLEPDAVHQLGREHLRRVQEERTALARRLGHADPAVAVAALEDWPGGRLAGWTGYK